MRLLKKFIGFLKDPAADFQARKFALLTSIGIVGVLIAFLGDIYLGENMVEIIVLGLTIVMLPFITFIAVAFDKLKEGSILICIGITCIILPVTFFFGGGPYGGGIIWMTFCYLYIGLVLTGAWRIIMLIMMTVFIVTEYLAAYYRPENIFSHSTKVFFIDSALSVVLLGFITYIVVWFQNQMFIDENKRARDEAKKVEELNRAQNRFFSNMSHEIRTPINTILGLNEVTLRRDDLPDDVISDARNIEGAGRMLLAMVNDILDMSRLESGSMEIVPVSYKVSDLLTEMVNMIWTRAEAKGLRLKVDVDPSTPVELFGDEVRIKQILINLLTNAIKYTKEGLVKLYVENEQIGDNEVMLTFAVTDTGMGIRKEALPDLFDAFKRVDEEKNRNIEGTGLGLSIVKQLVDLMGGEITVNSVYTQGSTFMVKLRQGIINPRKVGSIVIGRQTGPGGTDLYKQSFEAPEANVLIVDDNKLNIKVEKKLLEATKVNTDTALSGAEALDMTLTRHYDVILMDHLMPEMDGIECLAKIREQAGGLNKTTPVIVLTANAGSENQELYRKSGFDGYLCKPVAGAQLEEMLMKHISREKIITTGAVHPEDAISEETETFNRKTPLTITTSSLCDIPGTAIRHLNIGIIPITIKTESGEFWDGVETVADEMIKYMGESGKYAATEAPSVYDFERFFAQKLSGTSQIIHIAAGRKLSAEYSRAVQAAGAFGNVTVYDSGFVSCALGIIVLAACRMAQQNYDADGIVSELDKLKKRVNGTFILDSTEYMLRSGRMSEGRNMIFRSFMLHPMIRLRGGEFKVSRIWFGRKERARRNYLAYIFPRRRNIDNDILFVTYVGLSEYELDMIEKEIRRRINFKRIIFQKASAAISINSGPGTFGILYTTGGDNSLNISGLIPDEGRRDDDSIKEYVQEDNVSSVTVEADVSNPVTEEKKWYEDLEGINGEEGVKNCGSEEGYRTILDIYFESIGSTTELLNSLFKEQDWAGYKVKVHALKSSSKIIGAADLALGAQQLEDACNKRDADYIMKHHEGFINDYSGFENVLRPICGKSPGGSSE